jgi:hypothetical protein
VGPRADHDNVARAVTRRFHLYFKFVLTTAPRRRFAACKRSLNGVKRRNFGKITVPFLAYSSTVRY